MIIQVFSSTQSSNGKGLDCCLSPVVIKFALSTLLVWIFVVSELQLLEIVAPQASCCESSNQHTLSQATHIFRFLRPTLSTKTLQFATICFRSLIWLIPTRVHLFLGFPQHFIGYFLIIYYQ